MDDYGFIYVTKNEIDGMRYIGKKNYDSRGYWRRYLGSGVRLSRAIKKDGRENFTREIIDTAKTPEELSEKEKYWIQYYDAVESDRFYNIAPGGDGGNVRSGYSEEALKASEAKRLAAVRAGLPHGEDAGASKLTTAQVNGIIQEYLSGNYSTAIAQKYGVPIETVNDIKNHKTWKHLTDGIVFPNVSGRDKGVGKKINKPIDVFDKNMNYIATYQSARDAEAVLGVGYRLISQVCYGQKKTSHGYIFRFKEQAA